MCLDSEGLFQISNPFTGDIKMFFYRFFLWVACLALVYVGYMLARPDMKRYRGVLVVLVGVCLGLVSVVLDLATYDSSRQVASRLETHHEAQLAKRYEFEKQMAESHVETLRDIGKWIEEIGESRRMFDSEKRIRDKKDREDLINRYEKRIESILKTKSGP